MQTVSVAVALARALVSHTPFRNPRTGQFLSTTRTQRGLTRRPSSMTRHQHAAAPEEYPHVHFDTVRGDRT